MKYLILSCVIAVINLKHSYAQTKPFGGIRVYHENDFFHFFAANDDDNYTGGLRAEFYTNQIPLLSKLFNGGKWVNLSQSISYNVAAYTPTNLANPDPITGDRPYASFESVGYGDSYYNVFSKVKIKYELMLGKIGNPTAGKAQSYIHDHHWFGSTREVPQGWNNQIANGGSVAANLKLGWDKMFFETKTVNHKNWLRIVTENEVNLGNYMINGASGLSFRIFNYDTNFSDPETNPQITSIASPDLQRKTRFGFSLFAIPRVRFVAHNSTITGNLLSKSSVNAIDQSKINNILAEYEAGISLRAGIFRLNYSIYGRSKEFENATNYFNQWGGVGFGIIWTEK